MIADTVKKSLKIRLEKEAEKLKQELAKFATKDPKVPGDWDTKFPQFEDRPSEIEENAAEIEQYEKLLDVEHNLELRLKEIAGALGRMANGMYGICAVCKKEIPLARLEANPTAATCIDHAAQTR